MCLLSKKKNSLMCLFLSCKKSHFLTFSVFLLEDLLCIFFRETYSIFFFFEGSLLCFCWGNSYSVFLCNFSAQGWWAWTATACTQATHTHLGVFGPATTRGLIPSGLIATACRPVDAMVGISYLRHYAVYLQHYAVNCQRFALPNFLQKVFRNFEKSF